MSKSTWLLLVLTLSTITIFAQTPGAVDTITETIDSTTLNDINTLETVSIIGNEGFSVTSLWRGILGMLVLLGIAFLLSSNRRAINWRTTGIGRWNTIVVGNWYFKSSFYPRYFYGFRQNI